MSNEQKIKQALAFNEGLGVFELVPCVKKDEWQSLADQEKISLKIAYLKEKSLATKGKSIK